MNQNDYARGILQAYVGELGGITLCEHLLPRFTSSAEATEKLRTICELERYTSLVLKPVIERLGLAGAVVEKPDAGLYERVRSIETWADFTNLLINDLPPFVKEFDELAAAAHESDASALAHLAWHERALVAFGEAETHEPSLENLALLKWDE